MEGICYSQRPRYSDALRHTQKRVKLPKKSYLPSSSLLAGHGTLSAFLSGRLFRRIVLRGIREAERLRGRGEIEVERGAVVERGPAVGVVRVERGRGDVAVGEKRVSEPEGRVIAFRGPGKEDGYRSFSEMT